MRASSFSAAVPAWRRGLPSEVLRYFMLHRALIPERSPNAAPSAAYDAVMRARLEPLGAEFISASDVLCNAQGCLTRIGDAAAISPPAIRCTSPKRHRSF